MANTDGFRQRANMAMGGSAKMADSFGVEQFSSVNGGRAMMGGHPSEKTGHGSQSKVLADGARANPPHISRGAGKMPATAHSDHGPHGHDGGGSMRGQSRREGSGGSGNFGVPKLSGVN